jgi:hypothetical protein
MKIRSNVRAGAQKQSSKSINNAVFSSMTIPASRCAGV